jgi:hypothetical protein
MSLKYCIGVIAVLLMILLIYYVIRAYRMPGSTAGATPQRSNQQIDWAIKDLAGFDALKQIQAETTLISIGEPAVEPLITAFREGAYGGTFDYNQLNGPTEYAKVLGTIGGNRALDTLLEFLEGGKNYPENRKKYWYSNLAAAVIEAVESMQIIPSSASLPPASSPAWQEAIMGAYRLGDKIEDMIVYMGLNADSPDRDPWAYNLFKKFRNTGAALELISNLEHENLKIRIRGCLTAMLPDPTYDPSFSHGDFRSWINTLGDHFISSGPPMVDNLIKLIELGTDENLGLFGYYVEQAARALGEIGDSRAINPLQNFSQMKLSRSSWYPDFTRAAQQALQRLSERGVIDSSVEAHG